LESDVAIIGCGPAGIQAAIHAARRKVRTVLIGHPEKSALHGTEVENYFGVRRTEGRRLLTIGVEQAREFGARLLNQDVIKLERTENGFKVITDHDEQILTKSLILAPGVTREKLGIEGEKEFLGRGVSYCASCDCNFFRGRKVAVVGDGSVAASAALLLTDYASNVYWIAKQPDVAGPMMDKVRVSSVEMIMPAIPRRIVGDQMVTGLELEDGRMLEVSGVFIELGARSSMELALDVDIVPDPSGRIKVDTDCRTEVEGIFACGDATGPPWQLAKAVGEGCVAGTNAAMLVKGMG